MHLKRLIVAAVLLPPIYLYITYLPPAYFSLLLVLISSLALSEFYSMYNVSGKLKYACFFLGISILGVSFFLKDQLLNSIIVSVIVIMVIRLLVKRDPVSSLSDISAPVVGLIYVPVLCSFQMQIRQSGPEWIILLYGTVWASDSMAYYIGKGIGKKKLYKEVSPNKTVEGAVGSLLGGVIGALVLKLIVVRHLTISSAVFIGIMIGIVAIIGDLVESMFKRDAGVKDSGVIVPGHGGMLDKLDGVLFAGPVLYWILTAMQITK
jgi:phosphatidate cytidylyltransferase